MWDCLVDGGPTHIASDTDVSIWVSRSAAVHMPSQGGSAGRHVPGHDEDHLHKYALTVERVCALCTEDRASAHRCCIRSDIQRAARAVDCRWCRMQRQRGKRHRKRAAAVSVHRHIDCVWHRRGGSKLVTAHRAACHCLGRPAQHHQAVLPPMAPFQSSVDCAGTCTASSVTDCCRTFTTEPS